MTQPLTELKQACEVLRAGGIVACPTETLVGLLADAGNAQAVERVAEIKGRAHDAAIALLLPDAESVHSVAALWPAKAEELVQEYWPGPLTIVARAHGHVHARLCKDRKVGMRVPGASLALDLVRAYGKPLTATSANLSGEVAVAATSELSGAISDAVDLVLAGECPGGAPSTVVDVAVEPFEVLRKGAVEL